MSPTDLVLRIHNAAWGAANFIHHARHADAKPSQALLDAMEPVKDETLPGTVLLARSLVPIFGNYTVADAVYMVGMLRTIGVEVQPDRLLDSKAGEPITGTDLLLEVVWLFEHFICTAAASSEECVSARAAYMAKVQEGEDWKPGDHFISLLADSIRDDVSSLRRGHFDGGETFGHPFIGDRMEPNTWLFGTVRAEDGDAVAFSLLHDPEDAEQQAQ